MPVVLRAKRSPLSPLSFKKSYFVVGTTEEIWSIVETHWYGESCGTIALITKKLQGNGVSHDIAPAIAEKFVSKLQEINGQRPERLGNYGKTWECINRLLSGKELEEWIGVGCELSCRERCVGVLVAGIKEYMLFAWNYMQVHIEPIKMHIGGKDVQYTLPPYEYGEKKYEELSCDTIFKVSSPDFIGGLWWHHIPILPHRLKKKFMSLILESCQQFVDSIDKELQDYPDHLRNVAQKYIKKAYNVLVHKLLDRTGLPKLTAFQTRKELLNNVPGLPEWIPSINDINYVDCIDKVLDKIISFLSNTYIFL